MKKRGRPILFPQYNLSGTTFVGSEQTRRRRAKELRAIEYLSKHYNCRLSEDDVWMKVPAFLRKSNKGEFNHTYMVFLSTLVSDFPSEIVTKVYERTLELIDNTKSRINTADLIEVLSEEFGVVSISQSQKEKYVQRLGSLIDRHLLFGLTVDEKDETLIHFLSSKYKRKLSK